MHELDGLGTLEEVVPDRLDDEQVAGDQSAVHQRRIVVDQAGIETGNQRAG